MKNKDPMFCRLIAAMVLLTTSLDTIQAQEITRDIPYATPANARQMLDVVSPKGAKNRPVVFWIHGGGWQAGDKANVQLKPQWFVDNGFVFVSTNYRLLPDVDMETIVKDVAKSVGWVSEHISAYGGDAERIFVMGHSAGAQLAALICTDERYLKAEQVSLSRIVGCVPVDGDTFDIPAIIWTAEMRQLAHSMPQAKFGHREKFGNDPEKHRNFSAVNHVAKDKQIPPFLILHVAGHPDTSIQANRFGAVLTNSGVTAKVYGAKETTHSQINDDIGAAGDPTTKVLLDFMTQSLKR